MPKILLNLALSLDGYIEGPNGEFDWCFTDQDYGMTAFLERCEGIIFGRKSYEVLLQMDPNAFPGKKRYVFSQTLASGDENTQVLHGELQEELEQIKKSATGDLWFFGGASLLEAFLTHDLIDEMHLAIHPLLLGSGKQLFPVLASRKHFRLIKSIGYDSGMVQLVYGR